MDQVALREERYQKINKMLYLLYGLSGLFLIGYYLLRGSAFYTFLSAGTLLLYPLVWAFYRLSGWKRMHQMETVVLVFTFLSYTLGEPLAFYRYVPHYDKLMHALSGVLVMLLAFPWFYVLKSGHTPEKHDRKLAIAFCLMTSIAIAGLWEIMEYFLNFITHLDGQRALTSGVNDTMQDMIVCTLGSLACVPSISAYYQKDRRDVFMGAAETAIDRLNGR